MDLLEHFRTFAQIVESGSLSSAARVLGLSTAAVSRQLSTLEAELGAPLALRDTRKLTLTDAGRDAYAHAQRVLLEVERAREAVLGHRAVQGSLVLSAPVTLGLARVVPHLSLLYERNPGLRLELRLEDRYVDLVADGVDVALRAGPSSPPDKDSLVAHRIGRYRRALVASPSHLARYGEPAEPEELGAHPRLVHLGSGGGSSAWQLHRAGKEVRVDGPAVLRSNAVLALRDAALAGLGLALLPGWLVREEVEAGALRVVLPGWEAAETTVWALHRMDSRGAPRVRALLAHLRSTWEEEPAQRESAS